MKLTEIKLRQLIKEVMAEAEWSKVGGKDDDYFNPKDGVVFFTPNAKYEQDGSPTHDVTSHALKHSTDTGLKSDLSSLLSNFKNILKNHINSGGKVFYNKNNQAQEMVINDIDSLSRGDLKNTLDRINDDIVNKNKVSGIEQEISDLLLPLEDKYIKMSQDTINNPEATASLEKKKAYVKDGKMAITYDDDIVTFYGDKKMKKNPSAAASKAVEPRTK